MCAVHNDGMDHWHSRLAKLAGHDRGVLVSACGTGKTTICHAAARGCRTGEPVLVVVPTLALADQTVRAWMRQDAGAATPHRVTAAAATARRLVSTGSAHVSAPLGSSCASGHDA